MLNKVKKYGKYVGLFVAGYLACMFIGAGNANAGELKVFETGVRLESDFRNNLEEIHKNGTLYTKGEFDGVIGKNVILDWEASTDWTSGEFSKDVAGSAGIHYRVFKVTGDALEGLIGVTQSINVDDGAFDFDDVKTVTFRIRKPL